MDRQQILKQIQDQSKTAFAEARSQALREAVKNAPAVPSPAVASASGAAAGGGSGNVLPSNCIQFVVDTTDGVDFSMSFISTDQPITFTINWGDGTTHDDFGYGGYYEEHHTYPELNKQYTVRMCWDDPTKVLELDFWGDN